MIRQKLQQLIKDATGHDALVERPKSDFGDYAVFIKNAHSIFESIKSQASNLKQIEKIEIKGNYINFFLSNDFLQSELARMSDATRYAMHDVWHDKVVLVEYTDPNPFKLFHIGHMMSNAIGEAIARLYEASGAKVLRVNWQGDIGMHVAKAVWALQAKNEKRKTKNDPYAFGSKAFEENLEAKAEIEEINKKIYNRSDEDINKLYDEGRKASLEYFEKQYARLGTKFVHYFFESEEGPEGLKIVRAHPKVFVESHGAVVFHGSHTRVFINSQGLPTYEAKELGLNRKKFDLYHPDLSLIITGNEIKEYFKVLMEAMTLVMPDVAVKTRHIPHGMLRLPTGKMSSRTGSVITADELIEKVREKTGSEEVAIGAIKYAILKQGIGGDIVFDIEKSIAVQGDTGPYIQYTYARMQSILRKSQASSIKSQTNYKELNHQTELNIIKHLIEFPDAIEHATENHAPNHLALYLYELANKANSFYEAVRILTDEDEGRKQARLVLVDATARILANGLNILAIPAPEKM